MSMQPHIHKTTRSQSRKLHRRRLDVWPIRNEEDFARAVDVVDKLAIAPEGSLAPEDQDRLDIFTELIAAYEDRHHRVETAHLSPLDMVKYLMEQQAMTPSDLGRLLGNRQTGHDILSGRRQLSKTHIRKLAEHFQVSPAIFI